MAGTKFARFLPSNSYDAAINANAPTAANPFATILDLAGIGSGIYNGSGTIPTTTIATITDNVAFGTAMKLYSDGKFEIGTGASTFDTNCVTIGLNAVTTASFGVAIGRQASATSQGVAIGYAAIHAGTAGAVAIGNQASTTDAAVAVGSGATATGSQSTAVGYQADALGIQSISMGRISIATNPYSIAIGASSTTTGDYAIALGYNADGVATKSIGIGFGSTASAIHCIAIGSNSQSSGLSPSEASVVIGVDSKGVEGQQTVIGSYAGDTTGLGGLQSTSIGYRSNYGTTAIGNSSVAVGNNTVASFNRAVAIGAVAKALAEKAVSLGGFVETSGTNAITLGSGQTGGTPLVNNIADTFAIGWNATSPDILLGKTDDSYFNISGNMIIGGTAPANSKLEVNGDIETLGAANGHVVLDRIDGDRYRIYTENGVVFTELVV